MKTFWVLACFFATAYSHSPAILWPADQFHFGDGHSALNSMPTDDFKQLFHDKKVIIFHKRALDIEDVAYPAKPLHYLQSVDAVAVQGVKNVQNMIASLTASDCLKVVPLNEDQELSEQDQEIKKTMLENPGYAAVLIGSGSGVHRLSRRAAKVESAPIGKVDNKTNCLVYTAAVKKILPDGKKLDATYEVDCPEEGSITIKADGKDLILVRRFNDTKGRSNGYEVSTSENFRLDLDVTWAPDAFSFSCNDLRVYPKGNNTNKAVYSFERLQMYPKAHAGVFPESFDCSTWFTPSLCMGASVVIFYLAILFISVLLLLDVKTNDRFDDPKGKTITVNVSE